MLGLSLHHDLKKKASGQTPEWSQTTESYQGYGPGRAFISPDDAHGRTRLETNTNGEGGDSRCPQLDARQRMDAWCTVLAPIAVRSPATRSRQLSPPTRARDSGGRCGS
jgi:hypothetical protein